MIEVEKDFASKGVAGAGLGLGIAGTALALMGNGGLGNLLGGCGTGWNNYGNGCGNQMVNRYEAGQSARIAELETEVKLRDANFYTIGEIGKLRDYVDHRIEGVNAQLCQQAVVNAQVAANLSCLTNTVIPITSVCPEPMPMYNSWTAPTTTAGA